MRGHIIVGLIIIAVGLSILFNFPVFNYIFAFIILWIGVMVLTGQKRSDNFFSEAKGTINDDYLHRVLIFSGIKTKLNTDNFEGMELVTIFGGGEVDAGTVSTKKTDIDIELVSIFGGIKLKIPKGWVVKSEGTGILGGFNNNTDYSKKTGITVHLKGAAIFGSVEVIN